MQNQFYIIDITGQLISKIAATYPNASFAVKSKILPPDLVKHWLAQLN
jgi:hypothetical protein